MKLSIYCGLRAIAYVITDGNSIVSRGIKRVNISYDNYYEYIVGNPVTKRINRRLKRQSRKNTSRYKNRRTRLKRYLTNNFNYTTRHISLNEILELRQKATKEKITEQELCDVLMSMQRKRGYKSMRGVTDADKSEYLQKIKHHEGCITQYDCLASYLKTLPTQKNVIITRATYENEFNTIMNVQGINPETRNTLHNIIYFQRAIKKLNVNKCKYEKNRRVAHISNPIYQDYRVWRDVHNIRIYNQHNEELNIPFELKKAWAEKCNNGYNLTKASCLKDMGIKKPAQFKWFSGKAIQANLTRKVIGHDNAEDIWQDIYSATDDGVLAGLLRKKYKIPDHQIENLIDYNISSMGWSDISVKAIKKVLPLMMLGMRLNEAILHIYGVVDFTNVALRNVVLEQHYFATESLVKAINKKYKIDEVVFEIDYLLKLGNKGRKQLMQSVKRDNNFKITNQTLSAYNLKKLKLWEESGGISPYEPDYIIQQDELFTDEWNIDHIIPKSKLFERSSSNMVLARKKLNEEKNRMTGLDYAKYLGIEDAYLDVAQKFPDRKQEFLLMTDSDIPDNWISARQSADYNTKCFECLTEGINIPNKLIDRYYNQWIEDKYNQDDARHYLQKAWVLSNMNQDTVSYFDNLKNENCGSISVYNISPCVDALDVNVITVMPRIKFSRKSNYGYTPRHRLHGETVYGKQSTYTRNSKGKLIEEFYYTIRKPITNLSPKMTQNIVDNTIRNAVLERLLNYNTHAEGVESFINDPLIVNNHKIKNVTIRVNSKVLFPLHSTDGKGNTFAKDKFEKKIDYVMPECHYGIDVTNKMRIITLFEYLEKIKTKTKISNGIILNINDILLFNENYYYLIGIGAQLKIRPINTLSAKDEYILKVNDLKRVKKVMVNQFGEIKKIYELHDSKGA